MNKTKAQKRKPKMREHDRLVHNIAICIVGDYQSLKDAEKAVKRRLHLSSLQNCKSQLEILRQMWQTLKGGHAHKTMNEMVKDGYIIADEFEDFERKKAVIKKYQARAKHWNKTRKRLDFR